MKKLILILFIFALILNAQLYKRVKPDSNNLGIELVKVLEIRLEDNVVMVDLLDTDSTVVFSNTFFRLDRLPFELKQAESDTIIAHQED